MADLTGDPQTPTSPATTRSISPNQRPAVTALPQEWFCLDDHQAFAPVRPSARQQDPKEPINTTEAGATSSAALQHRNLVAQRDRFQQHRCALRGSLSATGTAPLVAIAMNAGYRQELQITNESARIKF